MDEEKKAISFNEFEEATKPAVQWLKENGDINSRIIIGVDYVELLSGQLGLPVKGYD